MSSFCLCGWKRLQVPGIVKLFQTTNRAAPSRHKHRLLEYGTHKYTTLALVNSLFRCRNTYPVARRHLADQATEDGGYSLGKDTPQELKINAMVVASAEHIIKAPISRYGDLGSKSKEEISECLQSFINNGLPYELLGKLVESPQILQNPQRLIDLLKTLDELAMSKSDIIKMIKNDSGVLKLRKEVFKDAFYNLLSAGLPSDTILHMFVEHPKLITADLSRLENRIGQLKELFTNQDTIRLMKDCPKLVLSDIEDIKKKFNYVYHEMGIEQPKMMRSNVFSHSLELIHVRHMFLVRAGFYRKVKDKDRFRNPSLNIILGLSNADFAKKFGNMTVDDYLCFQELLLSEKMLDNLGERGINKEYEDSLSDDEEDSDEDK